MVSRMEVQLAQLQVRHREPAPQLRRLTLAAPVDYPVIITGFASTLHLDHSRSRIASPGAAAGTMAYALRSVSWPPR